MFEEFNGAEALIDSPILMVLVICSIVTLGFALERLLYFRKRSGDADGTLLRTLAAVGEGRLDNAIFYCDNNPHPMGTVAAATIRCQVNTPRETEEVMQVALSQQKLLLERNTGMLGTMAAIAPLIGLLGTVWGIMRAFHAMGAAGSGSPAVVAAGVSEALITTAVGLIIAVPAVMLFNHFNRRLNTMLTIAENHTRSICVAMREGAGSTTANEVADLVSDVTRDENKIMSQESAGMMVG
ncbi:MAG: biopolymer transport protein ExbB [Candidatus Krumholzibacteriia bacterium]|jgi:biopolymer transport protein ExbB